MERDGTLPSSDQARGAFFVGVAEDTEPVEAGFFDEVFEQGEVFSGFSGKADDEAGAESDAGDGGADLGEGTQEDFGGGAALHALEDGGRGVLERQVEIFADVGVRGDGFEQASGDAVGIGVEEAEPAEAFDAGEGVEERGEAVAEAEVFAVTGGVLANEGDFADAAGNELLGFGDDGLEAAGAEFAAEVGDDTEGAGVVATLGDFDVGGGAGRGEQARGGVVVEVGGQIGRSAGPGVAREAAVEGAGVGFRAALVRSGLGFLAGAGFGVDGGEDGEGRGRDGCVPRSPSARDLGHPSFDASGFEDGFELAGAEDGVDFRDVFADLVAVTLDETAGDDELAGAAGGFVAGHFEDGRDRLLLGGVDEGTGVDDEDFGVLGAGGEARAGAVEEAHHDLGVDEVFGAAERDEAHGGGRVWG